MYARQQRVTFTNKDGGKAMTTATPRTVPGKK